MLIMNFCNFIVFHVFKSPVKRKNLQKKASSKHSFLKREVLLPYSVFLFFFCEKLEIAYSAVCCQTENVEIILSVEREQGLF